MTQKVPAKERLLQIMKERRMRQIDVVDRAQPFCKKYDIKFSRSTLSQYISGKFEPSQDKLFILGLVFNVNEAWLMGFDVPKERESVPAPVIQLHAGEDPIVDKYYRLNDQGQLMAVDYMDFLLTRYPAFPDLEEEPEETPDNVIPLFLNPTAAGYTNPVLTEDYIEVQRAEGMPKGADYALTVRGDSMEPYIRDGQLVYVQRVESLEEGEVGVWSWQGETYIKQAVVDFRGTVYLLSANPAREDANKTIPADQADDLKLLGKVLLPKRLPLPHYN